MFAKRMSCAGSAAEFGRLRIASEGELREHVA